MKKQYIASILLLIVVVDVYVARCNGQYMCYDSTSWQTNGIYWTRFYDPEGDVGAYFQDYGYTMGEENCKRLETLGYSCDSSATIIGELDGCTCATLHGHGNSNALALEYFYRILMGIKRLLIVQQRKDLLLAPMYLFKHFIMVTTLQYR